MEWPFARKTYYQIVCIFRFCCFIRNRRNDIVSRSITPSIHRDNVFMNNDDPLFGVVHLPMYPKHKNQTLIKSGFKRPLAKNEIIIKVEN